MLPNTLEIWVSDDVDRYAARGNAAAIRAHFTVDDTGAASGITVTAIPRRITGKSNAFQHSFYHEAYNAPKEEVGRHSGSLQNKVALNKIEDDYNDETKNTGDVEEEATRSAIVRFTGAHEIHHHGYWGKHDVGSTRSVMTDRISNVLYILRTGAVPAFTAAQLQRIKDDIDY